MKKNKVIHIIVSAVVLMCLVMAVTTWRKKVNAVSRYYKTKNLYEKSIVDLKFSPTSENVFALKKEREWLIEKEGELKAVLTKKKIDDQKLTPLEFKEELLNTQLKLKQLADIQGCRLQGDLGFSEYTEGNIPLPNEVSLISQQLIIVDEIVNLLLKYKVEKISNIIMMPYISYDKDGLYQEIGIKLRVRCVFENLLNILNDIVNAPYIFVVRNVNITKIDENRVDAELVIGAVEFN